MHPDQWMADVRKVLHLFRLYRGHSSVDLVLLCGEARHGVRVIQEPRVDLPVRTLTCDDVRRDLGRE